MRSIFYHIPSSLLLFLLSCLIHAQEFTLHVVSSSVENNVVAAYMREVHYDTDNYAYTEIERYKAMPVPECGRKDSPAPVVIGLGDDCQGTLLVYDGRGYYRTYVVEKGTRSVEIYNLTPGTEYQVVLLFGSDVLARTVVTPTGQLRMIRLQSVRNVRDLGGWASERYRHDDGTAKHIRYGRLYRGAEMDRSISLTADDRDVLLRDLHIGADLDLRGDKECRNITRSPLGEDVNYIRIPIVNYSHSAKTDRLAKAFRWMLGELREGRNVYFHCAAGADRTGTLAFLIEGILGVSESDMDKDYELTAFYGWRSRKLGENADYGKMIMTFHDAFVGWAHGDCCEQYLLHNGVTMEEIEEFRELMLD